MFVTNDIVKGEYLIRLLLKEYSFQPQQQNFMVNHFIEPLLIFNRLMMVKSKKSESKPKEKCLVFLEEVRYLNC